MVKRIWKYITIIAVCLTMLLVVTGCSKEVSETEPVIEVAEVSTNADEITDDLKEGEIPTDEDFAAEKMEQKQLEEESPEQEEMQEEIQQESLQENEMQQESLQEEEMQEESLHEEEMQEESLQEEEGQSQNVQSHLVVIDPGHQVKGNSEKEPIGPGAAEMKAKVTGGTSGRTTGLAEYELNLQVGLKLRDILVSRGYDVIMTRETNDVDMSNSERAAIANEAGAEAFVRIHANGSEDTSVNGAMTICPTPSNPYTPDIYATSRSLSDHVLDEIVASTGCKKQYVWETDTMSGINWCQVPVTIVEMGYMTNPTEDTNMASADYQTKMAEGIANGIDAYFAAQNESGM